MSSTIWIIYLSLGALFFFLGRFVGKKIYQGYPDLIGYFFVTLYSGLVILLNLLIDWLK